jgi:pimeloyl-ACP methyl ester carboxylesterase
LVNRRLSPTVLAVAGIVFLVSGCPALQPDPAALRPTSPASHRGGLVLVADGAGDFRATSHAVQKAITDEELPLAVETFVWSHGYWRILADQLDRSHTRQQGERLAARVLAFGQAEPSTPIVLLGHSAGCAVILRAAESLPPHSVERIVLFAPSVPADYDLRPALRAVRQEVDVFCSIQDGWYLRLAVWLSTVTSGRCHMAAGRVGFQPVGSSPEDAALYAKLRQFPWGPWLAWTGNEGGHFGYYQQGYLRAFVLPLLTQSNVSPANIPR